MLVSSGPYDRVGKSFRECFVKVKKSRRNSDWKWAAVGSGGVRGSGL